jgi:hypothetical protein
MRLILNLLATGREQEIDIYGGSTVGDLKDAVEKACAIEKKQMRIMFNGRGLEDESKTLPQYNIVDGSRLNWGEGQDMSITLVLSNGIRKTL